MTAAISRSPLISSRDRVAIAARAIEPILKQVVLAGPPVVDLLMNDPSVQPPTVIFAADSTLQLVSTSMIDRIGIDLKKLGLSLIGRTGTGDRWRISDDVAIDLIQVHADDGDTTQVWLEYATLLTLPLVIDERVTVRIAGGASMLALECSAFAVAGGTVLDSEQVERIVLLVSGRKEIERECAAAPPELRSFVAGELARFANNDTLQFVIERILPDAAALPALATRVREKFRRLAAPV